MLLSDDLGDGAALQPILIVHRTEFPAIISPEYPFPVGQELRLFLASRDPRWESFLHL